MQITLLPNSQVKLKTLVHGPATLLRQSDCARGSKCGPIYLHAGGPGSGRRPSLAIHTYESAGKLTGAQVNKALDKADDASKWHTDQMIEQGRGNERPSEWLKKDDELSKYGQLAADQRHILHNEIAQRYGPNAPSRLPHAIGRSPRIKAAGDEDEARDDHGRWTKGAGGLQSAPANKEEWPTHIQALKLPPAWTDVKISADPKAALQAVGKDSKGRSQYIYSQEFRDSQSAAKFARISELNAKFEKVSAQNTRNMGSKNPDISENAACAALVMGMGIRPGSEADTGAEKKAYGATTLEGRHVIVDGDKVSLQFVGKKGVDLNLPVHDPTLAADLVSRAKLAGPNGQLFPTVSNSSLLSYTHTLDGGGFKTKDMRTLLGTRTAAQIVSKTPAPTNAKEYKKAVKEVATQVSQVLGNTPTIALQSYIAPQVFGKWRASAKV